MPRQKLREESQGQKENGGAGPSGLVQPEEYRNWSVKNVIPECALMKLFEKLDPTDQVTFSRAHDEFHELVATKRPLFLAEEIAPFLITTLPKKALLNSRQLCKLWTQALNHQLPANKFESSEAIQRFLEEMEGHPGNPFPSRAIQFSWKIPTPGNRHFDYNPDFMEYWAHAFQILRKFGSNVQSFTVTHAFRSNYSVTLETLAHNLRECLFLLPNLKVLHILGGRRRGYVGGEGLESYFRRNPLPRLQYLERFHAFEEDPTVIETVLSSCPIPANMKSLNISYLFSGAASALPEPVFNFINLEGLETPIDIRDLQRLSTLDNVPPLRILDLVFPREAGAVNLKLVFKALQYFGNTLTYFSCVGDLEATRNDDEWETATYDLPNLKYLIVSYFRASYDPFVHFKSLTYFNVQLRDPIQRDPTTFPILPTHVQNKDLKTASPAASIVEHVEVLGFTEKMYDSNIWRLIPSLNNVTVEGMKYTRCEYDKICKAEHEAAATTDYCLSLSDWVYAFFFC